MNWQKSTLLSFVLALLLCSSVFGNKYSLDTIPFDCSPAFFQTYDNPSNLVQYDATSVNTGFNSLINFTFNVNSTGFNPVDNYIYTIARPNNQLIRVHGDGTFVNLGQVNGLGNNYVGDFTDDGLYYVKGGGARVYVIDVNTLNVTEFQTTNVFAAADWAFRVSDQTFYGVQDNNLYALNRVTQQVTISTLTGLSGGGGPYGAAFVTVDGKIYVAKNDTGNVYEIDVENLTATQIATGPSSGSNDGASCPNAPNPFTTHIFSENDSICIDTSGFADVNILANDEAYLNEMDINTFRILTQPRFGIASFNAIDSVITYSSTGEIFFDSLVYSICGDNVDYPACDTASVLFFPSNVENSAAQICLGTEYSFGGQTLQAEGEYIHVFSNQYGCDSTVTLNLLVNTPMPVTIDTTICFGTSYEFLGADYDQAGNYTQMVIDTNGCESLHTLNLIVIDPIVNNIEDTICDGKEVMIGDSIFTKKGRYSVELKAASMCDSIVNLDLTVLENSDYQIFETICEGDTIFAGNSFYTTAGTFEDIILNTAGCDSTITTELVVISLPDLEITNLEEICSPDKLTFHVRFEITGGDSSSYSLNGLDGNLVGNVFESDPMTSGTSYAFRITDATGCDLLEIIRPPFECLCETDAGTIEDELIEVCVGETASVFHLGNQFLDFNDSIIFVLHDGSRINFGNILLQQNSTDFRFDPSILNFNTTYFVAAVAGNIDLINGVDFDDVCLSVSNSAALIFRDLPSGQITGDQTICEGDSALISFSYNGFPPFEITYSDGNQNFNFSTNLSFYEIVISPSLSINYEFTEIRDAYCKFHPNEQVFIDVNTPPFAEIEPLVQVCNNNETGAPTTMNFNDLIINGDRTGMWIDLDNSGARGTFPSLNFEGLNAGTYRFEYQTNSAIAPCVNETYQMEVRVIDCLCPCVELGTPPTLCNIDAQLVLDDFKITTEAGSWRIVNEPIGSTAEIIGGVFMANNSIAGEYEIEFRLNQTPSITCPSTATILVTVSEYLTAGVAPPVLKICNDEQNISLNNRLMDASVGGVWTDVSDVQTSSFNASTGVLETRGILSGIYAFQYVVTPLSPCPADTSIINIEIDNPVSAGDFLRNIEFCAGENTSISLFDLIENNDAGGQWSLQSGSGISTNDFDETSGFLNIENLSFGEYEFQYKVTAIGICPNDSITVKVIIDTPVEAGTLLRNVEFCEGDNISFNLFELIENYDGGGQWSVIAGNLSSSNDFDETSGFLNIENLIAGSYDFQYKVTAVGICPADSVTVNIVIDAPVSAGDLIQKEEFCEATDISISLFDYIENYDLGGNWSLVFGNKISPNDFNEVSGDLLTKDLLLGSYEFKYEVESTGACPNDQVIFPLEIHPVPIADAGDDKELDCLIREVEIGGNGQSGFDYKWESSFNIPNLSNPTTTEEGLYVLIVTDTQTGCVAMDSVMVLETANYPQLQPNSIDLSCYGANDGIIRVENVNGGTPPFLYSLNSAPFTDDDIFENLTPGEYHLLLEDSKGCTDEFIFQIFEPNELIVTLSTSLIGNSNVIQFGDSLQLQANISDPIDSMAWSPIDSFEPCDPESDPDGCLRPWVYPTSLTTYEVFVINENGCNDWSSITVDVEFNPDVYIPSAFTPNNDGINDVFEIYTDETVERIQTFLVFDRWGESVFEAYDFKPGNPVGGWNGKFRDEKMNTAVFVYYAEILFINGETKFFEGDISLLR